VGVQKVRVSGGLSTRADMATQAVIRPPLSRPWLPVASRARGPDVELEIVLRLLGISHQPSCHS